jgi:hypothetical protein
LAPSLSFGFFSRRPFKMLCSFGEAYFYLELHWESAKAGKEWTRRATSDFDFYMGEIQSPSRK